MDPGSFAAGIDRLFRGRREKRLVESRETPEVASCSSCGRTHWHPAGWAECVSCELRRWADRRASVE